MAAIFKPAYAFYSRHYQARPILTICTTNALLAGISDTLTQKYLFPVDDKLHLQSEKSPPSSLSHNTPIQDSARFAKESVEAAGDHVKTFGQQAKKEVSERGMEGAKDMAEGYGKAGKMAQTGKQIVQEHAPGRHNKDVTKPVKESAQFVKESAEAAKDHVQTFGKQTAKEVKERGVEGAKDMAEGYGKAGKEMAQTGKQIIQEHVPSKDSARDAVESVKDTAQSAKDSAVKGADSVKDNLKGQAQQTADSAKGSAHSAKEASKEVFERGVDAATTTNSNDSKESGKQALRTNKDVNQAEHLQGSMDYPRLGRFMFYNFSVAPLIHTWYGVLDRNFPISSTSNPAAAGRSAALQNPRLVQTVGPALKRMVGDQVLFAPIGLALLFSGLTVLEGGGVKEIKDKLTDAYIPTLKANYAVWPLVQLVNFSIMPLPLRLPFVSVVGIAWNAYLSLMNSKSLQAEHLRQHQPVMA